MVTTARFVVATFPIVELPFGALVWVEVGVKVVWSSGDDANEVFFSCDFFWRAEL